MGRTTHVHSGLTVGNDGSGSFITMVAALRTCRAGPGRAIQGRVVLFICRRAPLNRISKVYEHPNLPAQLRFVELRRCHELVETTNAGRENPTKVVSLVGWKHVQHVTDDLDQGGCFLCHTGWKRVHCYCPSEALNCLNGGTRLAGQRPMIWLAGRRPINGFYPIPSPRD